MPISVFFGSYGSCVVRVLGNCYTVFQCGRPISYFPSNVSLSVFSRAFEVTVLFCFLRPLWCSDASCSCICTAGGAEHLSPAALPLCPPLWIVSACLLSMLWLDCLVFILLGFESSLYSRCQFFDRRLVYKPVLPVCGLSFPPLNRGFHKTKGFNFDEVRLSEFSLCGLPFWCQG